MVFGMSTLRDDAESMILLDCAPADASQEPLLHPTVKANDRNFRRRLTDQDVIENEKTKT